MERFELRFVTISRQRNINETKHSAKGSASHPMKILFVHQYCGAMGGAETDILLGAGSLKNRGHAVALLYSSHTGRSEAAWQEAFCEFYSLGHAPLEKVRTTLSAFRPDVIYFHSLLDLVVLKALLDSETPVVRRVHDHRMYCMRGAKYNYFTRAVCHRPASWRCVIPCLGSIGRNPDGLVPFKWVSYQTKKREIELNRHCDCLLVYSEYQKEELARNGFDPAKIEVRLPVHDSGGAAPESSLDERNLVLFVGQVIRGKGVDLLLRALAKVRVPFQAGILGDGNHRPYCERLCARLGLGDRVKFHGFVARDELSQFYQQASLLAVSSVWPEPFGLIGREAMTHALPVVAFDAGGIREWLFDGENGFLVPWKDTACFAARIEQLLSDKNLARQMGRRGRELVSQQQAASSQICPVEQVLLRAAQRRNRDTQYAYEK
jgi:glycosyltransferase involved in cell wall biosynthesis